MLRSSSARYSTASHAGHLIQSPSGTDRVRRSVLIREGMIFSNQVIYQTFVWSFEVLAVCVADGRPKECASILGPARRGKPRPRIHYPHWVAARTPHTGHLPSTIHSVAP